MAKKGSSDIKDSKDRLECHQASKRKPNNIIDPASEQIDPLKTLKQHKKTPKISSKKKSTRISHVPPGSPPSSPGAFPVKARNEAHQSLQAETKKLSLSPPTRIPQSEVVELETTNVEETPSSLSNDKSEKIQLVPPSPVSSQVLRPEHVSSGQNRQHQQQHHATRTPSDTPLVVAEPVQMINDEQNEEYVAAEAARQLEERMKTLEWQKRLEQDVEAQLQSKKKPVVNSKKETSPQHDDASLCCGSSSPRTWGVGVLILLMVTGGLVGMLVAVLGPNPSPTSVPTEAPTSSIAPTLSRRDYILETLGAKITPNSNSTTTEWEFVWNDPSTPQGKALLWLSEEDNYSSHPYKLDTQVLLERYVLAVFYFSMSNPETLSSEAHFLDGDLASCQWNNGGTAGADGTQGVHCTDMTQERSVSYMELENLNLQGSLPWELSLMQNLMALYLDSNALTGTIPTQISNLSKLQDLFLHSNLLTGPIPTNMPTSLQSLSLAENRLTGRLSSEWASSVTSLTTCLLGNNRIEGSIPPELGAWSNLWWLDLGDNAITGSIPRDLGSLGTNIQHLYLDRNALTGSLPTELGNLSKLQRVYVHHNVDLTGTVPTEYAWLTNLDMFLFCNTSLVGSVDSIFCDTNDGALTLWGDCGGASPEIQCSCCTKCCSVDGGNC